MSHINYEFISSSIRNVHRMICTIHYYFIANNKEGPS